MKRNFARENSITENFVLEKNVWMEKFFNDNWYFIGKRFLKEKFIVENERKFNYILEDKLNAKKFYAPYSTL